VITNVNSPGTFADLLVRVIFLMPFWVGGTVLSR
jgi:hypothetical protein